MLSFPRKTGLIREFVFARIFPLGQKRLCGKDPYNYSQKPKSTWKDPLKHTLIKSPLINFLVSIGGFHGKAINENILLRVS